MARRPPRAKFHKTVFDNGLTLVTESNPGFRSVSMGVWVKVGTRHETARDAGVSHFLEHMLFKGTEARSSLDIARAVDQVGGEFNAFTDREHTCFHLLLLDRDVGLGMDILGDVLMNSTFDGEELERERRVILQEISMVEETPEELAHDAFFEIVYGRHGLGRPILGTESSIRRMRRQDLLRFFRTHYRPEQIVVSVAGDVDPAQVKRRLKAWTRNLWPGRPSRAQARHSLVLEPAPALKPGLSWIRRPTEQVHLVWGMPGLPFGSRDRFAALLLNVFLGGGMSSSLFQEIREKAGLAYSVYSSLAAFSDSGVFSIYAATPMGQVLTCLRLIEECVERLQKELLKEDELKTVQNNLKGTILLAADGVESRMTSIATNEIMLGKYISPEEVCRRVDEVTPADVRRVARRILAREERYIVALGPRPSKSVSRLKPVFPARFN